MQRFALSAVVLLASCASDAPQNNALTVTDPVAGKGKPYTTSFVDLTVHGYAEKERFYEGDAVGYEPSGELSEDGKWTLEETDPVPFKSRLLVRRPIDAAKFNGTVVIEWLNVSGGVDSDPGFIYNWEELLREGYAWVGVSAQKTGVDGGGGIVGTADAQTLKQFDPERYGSLIHPGDRYSYDIYTHAAELVRAGVVLDGLEAEHLIAYGESQSAARMIAYVNGVQPRSKAFDGFFVHSRSSAGADFGDAFTLPFGGKPHRIRDDQPQKVFQFQTETDVLGLFGYASARQPDSDILRSWEVAGTAHADAHILSVTGEASSVINCKDVNDGPQHFVIKAALHSLHVWLKDGTAPAKGEPLGSAKDEHGNTLGGIRTPHVDVPTATLSGEAALGGDILCSLFGKTTPFSKEKLAQLYPTHEAYVSKVAESARKAREAGFVLAPEEKTFGDQASASSVP